MCGICGILQNERNTPADPAALQAMNDAILHRGPDDAGYRTQGNIALAMRRLSIIDLATGHQPISNESGDIWIVFNGEIYNHRDLRRGLESRGHRYATQSDTESIVHLYEEYGVDCVHHLRGMFAFALWDCRQRRLFAARDRFGIKPFYYSFDPSLQGRFVFASEMKALLRHPSIRAELNRAALGEYLAFGYVTGEQTLFRGIRKLMPGCSLTLTEGAAPEIHRYYELPAGGVEEPHPREYYVAGYRERLAAAVQSHLMSDVPLGVFLSGGLDSSAVAALARPHTGRLKTFSVGYAEAPFSELPYARRVARHLGTDHHEVALSPADFFAELTRMVWHEDEPLAWPSSVPLFAVARKAREHVKVVLTGEGSDETLGGYSRYAWTLMNAGIDSRYRKLVPAGLRRHIAGAALSANATLRRKLAHTFLVRSGEPWSAFYFDNFYSAFSLAEQNSLLTPDALAASSDPYAGAMRAWDAAGNQPDLLRRMLATDIGTYMVELLMKQDQMSMAASIESRVPFLDHELVEFALRIPARFNLRRGGFGGFGPAEGKSILKDAMRGLLPNEIIHRKKMGFPTPWDLWLSGEPLNQVEAFLTSPRAMDRNLLRADGLAQIFADHRARRRDIGNRIWRLLNLELWMRVFLDGDREASVSAP